ncbi:MAG: hypothetical protein ACHREM_29015 [Polyangiales bacterium]
MSSPQNSARRLWQKKRRTKKLALWHANKAALAAAAPAAPAKK